MLLYYYKPHKGAPRLSSLCHPQWMCWLYQEGKDGHPPLKTYAKLTIPFVALVHQDSPGHCTAATCDKVPLIAWVGYKYRHNLVRALLPSFLRIHFHLLLSNLLPPSHLFKCFSGKHMSAIFPSPIPSDSMVTERSCICETSTRVSTSNSQPPGGQYILTFSAVITFSDVSRGGRGSYGFGECPSVTDTHAHNNALCPVLVLWLNLVSSRLYSHPVTQCLFSHGTHTHTHTGRVEKHRRLSRPTKIDTRAVRLTVTGSHSCPLFCLSSVAHMPLWTDTHTHTLPVPVCADLGVTQWS